MQKMYLFACAALFALSSRAQIIWNQDFEGGTVPPTGWTSFDNGVGTLETWSTSAISHGGATAAFVQFEDGGAPAEDWLVTDQIDLTSTNSELRFFTRQEYSGDFATTYEIRISTASQNNPADFVTVASWNESALNAVYDTYEEKIVNLAAYDGDQVYIAFVMTQEDGDDWYIDDLTVGAGPTCPAPSLVQFANVDDNSADVMWTAGSTETAWNIEYGPAGFTPGTGTVANITTTPAFMIPGLSPETEYDVYVQADCGGGNESTWTGPVSFTTSCVVVAVTAYPWTEDFDAVTTPGVPCGWTVEDVNNDGYKWLTSDESPQSGLNSLYISYNANEEMNDWVYTPELVLEAGTSYRLSFASSVGSETYPENLAVFIGSAQSQAAMTTGLLDLPDMDNEAYETRFVDFTVPVNGSYYIGFHGYSEADMLDIYVDDVTIDFSPSCPEPTAVTAGMIGSDVAAFSWTTVSGQTNWNIEYGAEGFMPGTGTTDIATGTPAYTISALDPETTYDFYVQSDCGGGDLSVWTGPYTFTTTCAPVAVTSYPWTENFDAETLPDLPCGWLVENANNDDETWITDSNVSASQPNALYIEYNANEAMNDWAYTPELVLVAGTTYSLGFKYVGSGTTYPESMNVYIGSAQANGSMTTQLIDLPNIVDEDFVAETVSFTVPANGSYYIGFHGYSEADMYFLAIDDVSITECNETAAFTLSVDTICLDDPSVTPVVTGTAGGWFYGTAGLDVDQTTGAIDPAASTAGDHFLYYVTSMTSCADTETVAVVIEDCDLGVEESALAGLQLYPNPTNGFVTVSIPVEDEVTVSVTDFAGKEVMVVSVSSGQTIQLDLSMLNNGVYFVQFRLNDAKEMRRVVLTK